MSSIKVLAFCMIVEKSRESNSLVGALPTKDNFKSSNFLVAFVGPFQNPHGVSQQSSKSIKIIAERTAGSRRPFVGTLDLASAESDSERSVSEAQGGAYSEGSSLLY